MSIAPQNLMSTLRGMPDAQLQKYAAMHKNDPFVFPLAFQESQDRQRARAAQQAQGQQPPKVVDQDLQQMMPQPAPQPMMPPQQMAQAPQQAQQLPENTGIGQLPAPNLQKMAEGGIVAFGDGGEVPGYAEKGLVELPGGLGIYNQGSFAPQPGTTENQPWAARKMDEIAAKVRAGTATPQEKAWISAFGGDALKRVATRETQAALAAKPTDTPPVGASTANTTGLDTSIAKTPSTAPAAPPAAPTAVNPNAPLPGKPSVDSYANQVMGIDKLLPKKEEAQSKEAFTAEREAVSKPVWEKFQSTVDKEKNRLSEGKEQDFYMALIEGGLAAAGGTGPNGLQNIAQGFSKGASSYSAALKDFRKASQENSKMELDMERAKAAEKRGDLDAYQRYEDSIKNRNADIDKLRTSGIFALQNVHTAGQYQQQAAATTAAGHVAAAKLPGAQERLFATLGGGDVTKGLKIFQEAQTDKTGAAYAKLYSDYAANADKSGAEKMSPIEFAQNMQQFMGAMQGGGFQSKPTNSTVRTLPGT